MANLHDYNCMKEKKYLILKLLWSLIYCIFIGGVIAMIVILQKDYFSHSTITTLESTYHSVEAISFPGVAICSFNKLHKKKVKNFAEEIANKTGQNFNQIFEATLLLGKLFDFDYDRNDEENANFLMLLFRKFDLNLIEIMKSLQTDCAEMLRACEWLGVAVDCSKFFYLRRTSEGYCCIFNYVKSTPNFRIQKSLAKPLRGKAGLFLGLKITVMNDLSNYSYVSLDSRGVKVQVFVPTDYPDYASGSLNEIIVPVNEESFLQILPSSAIASPELKMYPVSARSCLFDEERPTTFQGIYSQSDCNVDCRVESIMALCQCIPFYIPISTKDTVCTLDHLQCLNLYKNKWSSVYPEEDQLNLLQKEQHDSLRCRKVCWPSCEGTSYGVINTGTPIKADTNLSIINLFYASKFSNLYKHDVVLYWFESISSYGGIFGIMVGASLITIIEFLLFCLQQIIEKSTL